MTTVNAKAAREQFSSLMSAVAQGKSVTITRRGEAVALLSPLKKRARQHLPDLTAFRAALKRPGGKETTITDLRRMERY